ncbi:MAG: phytoene desaturase [Acidobacteriales bacterium]|nr:phytoene desaturase [Terriglobales bacterium]
MKERVGVIGAGLGGLAAACTLAARGYRVTVFEKNAWIGGKAAVLERDGFRFDMGPTILIQPSVLGRIFSEAGADIERDLPMVRLEPEWRSFFEDGSALDLLSNTEEMASRLEKWQPGTGAGYRRFMQSSEKLHEISNRWFFWRPVDSVWSMFDPGSVMNFSLLKDVREMRLGKTVTGTIKSFVREPRVVQMLEHFVQYVGSAPDSSPAILCAIANMQTTEGIWYPLGGTAAIPRALHKLALSLGVEFRTGVEVSRILHDGTQATGVELEGGEAIDLAAVVSNSDAIRTHSDLLRGEVARRFSRKDAEPACSGVVLYLGLNRRYEHLLHHNFVFSRDPQEEFEAIYRRGEPAPDPTCYLCAPAATDPTVAPQGGEALYVLVHTPYLRDHHDWGKMFPAYRETIIAKLRRCAGLEDIESRIVSEAFLTPEDIGRRYRVLRGAIYGIASHGRMSGGFKPGNVSSLLRNLYLCGGAAHPGPGMPMVLMSGWIAADALDREGKVQKAEATSWAAFD